MGKDLGKELAKIAKEKGICREWYDQLRELGNNRRAMVNMYVKGIDFCLANDFPDNDCIKRNFTGVAEEYGVFVDTRVTMTNCERCVALGKTTGNVSVGKYNVCEIFAKHDSDLCVSASDNAFVELDVFDNAVVHITATGMSRVHVNRYDGGTVIVDKRDSDALVKITDKKRKTY